MLRPRRAWPAQRGEAGYRAANAADLLSGRCRPGEGQGALLLDDRSAAHGPPVSREQFLALDGVPAQVAIGAMLCRDEVVAWFGGAA